MKDNYYLGKQSKGKCNWRKLSDYKIRSGSLVLEIGAKMEASSQFKNISNIKPLD